MTSARPFFMWFLLVGMAKKGSFLLLFYLPWKQEKIKTYHGYREFISFWQLESLWHNR